MLTKDKQNFEIQLFGKESYQDKNMDFLQQNKVLELRVLNQEKEINALNAIVRDYEGNKSKLSEKLSNFKNESLKYEKRINELVEEKEGFKLKYEKVCTEVSQFQKQISIHKKQIIGLKEAFNQLEQKNSILLKDKKELGILFF